MRSKRKSKKSQDSPRPRSFQLTENEELYYLGSAVRKYLGNTPIYTKYGLIRRVITKSEKDYLVDLNIVSKFAPTSLTYLVRASQVEDLIFKGEVSKPCSLQDVSTVPTQILVEMMDEYHHENEDCNSERRWIKRFLFLIGFCCVWGIWMLFGKIAESAIYLGQTLKH